MNVLLLSLLLCAAQAPQTAPEQQPAAGAEPQATAQDPQAPARDPAPALDPEGEAQDPAAEGEQDVVSIETRLATSFEGALADSKNGEPFAETAGYARLISSLAAYTPEDVAARATADLDHAAVMGDPDRFRGEFVRVRGLIVHLEAVRLDVPIFGATDVYRGLVTKADGSEGVWFDMLEAPPSVELEKDVVDLEGVLYRTVTFENRKGEMQTAPWLVVRNFRVPDPDSLERNIGPSGQAVKVLMVLVLAYFAGRLLVFLRQQSKQRTRSEPRQGTSIRQMMLDQREKRDRESPRPPRS